MKIDVNYRIAFTHIRTRRRQTIIAALGVTVGIALYIFSNSIVVGVSAYSRENLFKSAPHLRIYREDRLSVPIQPADSSAKEVVITNPRFTATERNIENPTGVIDRLNRLRYVRKVAPNVSVDLFYRRGTAQVKGVASGVDPAASDAMFDLEGSMVAGRFHELINETDGVVIGQGIADRLHTRINDYITVVSSEAVVRVVKVIGIFSTGNKNVDDSRSYVNINTARILLTEGPSTVTDIFVMVHDPDSAEYYANDLRSAVGHDVEDWKTANEDQLAQNKMLGTMTPLISFSILLVAAFGIYNIVNMTITQKLNDIAILKANGFRGSDIVRIFTTEALIMGSIGTVLGLLIGTGLVAALSNVYVGPPVGYFPVRFDATLLLQGAVFGMAVSLGAGYFPARKAAKVDPVSIFRK